jgi:hypothetical protein
MGKTGITSWANAAEAPVAMAATRIRAAKTDFLVMTVPSTSIDVVADSTGTRRTRLNVR